MIKLAKSKAVAWNGNGFGTSTADWVVKGNEHIEVYKLGWRWVAFDTSPEVNRVICRADTKSEVAQKLEAVLA